MGVRRNLTLEVAKETSEESGKSDMQKEGKRNL